MSLIEQKFDLQRSGFLIRATFLGHLLALIALSVGSLPQWLTIIMATGVIASLIRSWQRPWPVQLRPGPRGHWTLTCSDGRVFPGNLVAARVIAPGVIAITLSGQDARSEVFLADAFCDGDHNRLMSLLRHRCDGAAC